MAKIETFILIYFHIYINISSNNFFPETHFTIWKILFQSFTEKISNGSKKTPAREARG